MGQCTSRVSDTTSSTNVPPLASPNISPLVSRLRKPSRNIDGPVILSGSRASSISTLSSSLDFSATLLDSPARTPDTFPRRSFQRRISWSDAGGHELIDVQSFRKDDEAWRLNKHKYGPLVTAVGAPIIDTGPLLNSVLPTSNAEMEARLKVKAVQLETVMIKDDMAYLSIRCLGSSKKGVAVRWSNNGWASAQEAAGVYAPGADDQCTRFRACIPCPPSQSLHFAIKYKHGGSVHWDNNNDVNYTLNLKRPTPAQQSRPKVIVGRVPSRQLPQPLHTES